MNDDTHDKLTKAYMAYFKANDNFDIKSLKANRKRPHQFNSNT